MENAKAVELLEKGIGTNEIDAQEFVSAYKQAIKSLNAWDEVLNYGEQLIKETEGGPGHPRWISDNAQIYIAGVNDVLKVIRMLMGENNGEKRM